MPVIIRSTPPSEEEQGSIVALDSTEYNCVFYWGGRAGAGFMSLYTLDGTPVLLQRRMRPNWSPTQGLHPEDIPAGIIMVLAKKDYNKSDLGSDVITMYYPASEVPEPPPRTDVVVRIV